jgi:hypothetical protein
MNNNSQPWRIGTPFPLHLANVNLPSLKSSASIGALSASGVKPWKDKAGKIDLAKLFDAENAAAGLVRRK